MWEGKSRQTFKTNGFFLSHCSSQKWRANTFFCMNTLFYGRNMSEMTEIEADGDAAEEWALGKSNQRINAPGAAPT